MNHRAVPLIDIAEFNPSPPRGLTTSGEEVAFVPMAAVSEDGAMVVREHRRASDLGSGMSYFQSDDVLVAKITPCYENNKITAARLDRPHGFGSTEFHVIRSRADRLDSRYLSFFLRQDRIREQGVRRMMRISRQRGR